MDSKNYLVRTINSEINIDGIGDETEWSKSKWESDFWMWRPTDSLQANKQTRFKLIRNDKYLFKYYVNISLAYSKHFSTNISVKFSWSGILI